MPSVFSPIPWLSATFAALLGMSAGNAQVVAPVPNAVSAAAPASVLGAPTWSQLNTTQQQSLAPLASTWNTLPEGQRRKWIALGQNYPNLAANDQQKLHSRMVEWAALNPKEREQARLNFTETKKIAPSNLAANWEAYQALSPEERKKLAADAQPKQSGAAVAIKPNPPSKLAEVPKATNTPDTKRPLITKPQSLDKNTLLPTAQKPGATASAPAKP